MLDRELGLAPSRALQQLQRAILAQDSALERNGSAPPPRPATEVCPFKGLAAFEATDAGFFFGRERIVAGLVARLAQDSFVALVGASGSGKSSTLRAGLVPALAEGALPSSTSWPRVFVRPGSRPLGALEAKLDGDVGAALEGLSERQRLILVVDQFEELFAACSDEPERAAFVDALVTAATDPDRRAIVVLGVRADFYGRCAAYPELAELLSGRTVLLRPMTRDELKRAIAEPARRGGLEVEPALTDALAGEVADALGGLPLLSSTLLELWERRDGERLTLASYRETGGVEASVARLAEGAYAALDERERTAARRVLLRLAGEEDGSLVGRQLPLGDFDARKDPTAARVLSVLTGRRLLTVSHGNVELAHDALLRHWPRLGGWLEEDADGRRLHGHLMHAAREWDASGRDPAELYRGARLAATLVWAAGHPQALNALEREFLDGAREERDRESARERRQNRRLRAALAGALALLTLTLAAGAVALVQRHAARRSARVSLASRLGAQALIEPRVDRALLLAREAVALDNSPDTAGALLGTLLRSPAATGTFSLPLGRRPQRVVVSPDGRALAVSDNSPALHVYDARTHRELAQAVPLSLGLPAAFAPHGTLVAAGSDARGPALQILDARTLRPRAAVPYSRRLWKSPSGLPVFLLTSGDRIFVGWHEQRPDGSGERAWLDAWHPRTGRWTSTSLDSGGLVGAGLTAGRVATVTDTQAATWDRSGTQRLSSMRVDARGGVAGVAPDGRRIAIADPRRLRFVDLRTGTVRRANLLGEGGLPVFSPDGRLVATPGADGNITLWDPRTARVLDTLTGHGGHVIGLAFAADGRTLYSSSLDGAVFSWDLSGRRRLGHPFRAARANFPQTFAAPPLAVAPDGSAFVTRTTPAALGVFTARTLRRGAQFMPLGPGAAIRAVAWGPEGELAAGDAQGRVVLWRMGRPARMLGTVKSAVVALAISPDGRTVAAAEGDPNDIKLNGSLTLWRTGAGAPKPPPMHFATNALAVAFSPDGARLAVALGDGRALLLDARTQRLMRSLRFSERPRPSWTVPTSSLAFAPDGTLATGSFWGILERWNPATGARLGHPLLAAAGPIGTITFAPDGATFATTGGDGGVKLWDTQDEQQLGSSLPGSPGQWANATFTPDGRALIAVSDDGNGTVWPATVRAWEQQACMVAARTLTRAEWTRYVPGRPYARVC